MQLIALLARALIALAVIVLYKFFTELYKMRMKTRSLAKDHGIPILPHSFFLGHLIPLAKAMMKLPADINDNIVAWALQQAYPEICEPGLVYVDIWPIVPPMLLAFDPEIVKQFCQDPSAPKHPLLNQHLYGYTQNLDILNLEGEEWKTWRAIFNPCFSVKNMLALLPDFIEEIGLFEDALSNAAKTGETIKLDHATMNTGCNIIMRALVGKRIPIQTTDNVIYKLMKAQTGWIVPSYHLRNLPIAFNPFRHLMVWYNNRLIHKIFAPVVQEVAREVHDNKPRTANTVANLSARAYHHGSFSNPDRKAGELDPAFLRQVIAHLKLFVFAGSDTTSTTLCFSFYYLSIHADALEKVRAEHDAVLGPDPSRAAEVLSANPGLINQLPYTAAVMKEVLRLNPPAASIRAGAADRPIVHPETKHKYPTDGFMLTSAAHAVSNSPKYWTNPEVFNPDRWFDQDGKPAHPVKNSYRPFELGPRNCIGQELARTEMALILALSIRQYDFEAVFPKNTPTFNGYQCYLANIPGEYLPRPKGGMPVKVRSRKHVPSLL